jgi:hypothetical protein
MKLVKFARHAARVRSATDSNGEPYNSRRATPTYYDSRPSHATSAARSATAACAICHRPPLTPHPRVPNNPLLLSAVPCTKPLSSNAGLRPRRRPLRNTIPLHQGRPTHDPGTPTVLRPPARFVEPHPSSEAAACPRSTHPAPQGRRASTVRVWGLGPQHHDDQPGPRSPRTHVPGGVPRQGSNLCLYRAGRKPGC